MGIKRDEIWCMLQRVNNTLKPPVLQAYLWVLIKMVYWMNLGEQFVAVDGGVFTIWFRDNGQTLYGQDEDWDIIVDIIIWYKGIFVIVCWDIG